MNITLIGTGNMGSALANQLTKAGHNMVIVGRNVEKAKALAEATSAAYRASNATDDADVVIVATAYENAISALAAVGNIDRKVVVDITNPLTADFMGLTVGHSTSAAEEIQNAYPNAKVIKAFNTIFAQVMADGPTLGDTTLPVYFAGNYDDAKNTVRELIQSIGFQAVDVGPLKNARYLEPLAGLNIYLGYGAGHGTNIAPTWIGIG